MNNMDIIKTGLKAWEMNDEATLSPLVANDFQLSGPVPQPLGKQEFLGLMHIMHASMPDFAFNISSFEENGDTIIAKSHITGTHTGTLELPGLPPFPATNIKVSLPEEIQIYTLRNGQISQLTTDGRPDAGIPGMLAQLGVALPQ
ncbi:MAG TPA: ester cyclase [Ktedonobacteraceae bacterium]|nr:ester cyclase [Ktedonobacteraceae bacterium]